MVFARAHSDRLPLGLRLDAAGVAILLLAGVVALGLVEPIAQLHLQVSKNYNEGWNAYYALRAVEGRALYPGDEPLLINNYPPLSFYVVGALGALIGDHVIAGRIISLVALLATAAGIALAVRRTGAPGRAAIVAALAFVGGLAALTPDYVGMNDPQLLAHAVATAGLVILIGRPRHGANLALAAGLMVLAGLIKHNLIALPLAATVWLAVDHRPVLGRWLLAAIGFAAIAALGLLLAYGPIAFASILTPRTYSVVRALDLLRDVLVTLQIPLVLWLSLGLADRRATEVRLIVLYGVVALLVGAGFAGGTDTYLNLFYDLLIALAVASGLLLARVPDWLERTRFASPAEGAIVLALVVGIGVSLPLDPVKRFTPSFAERSRDLVAASAADIAWLRAHEGPALCRTLALCYWADKRFEVDPFNVEQAIAVGRLDADVLLERIAARDFAAIQWPRDHPPPRALVDALERHYERTRTSPNGDFFTPRAPAGADPRPADRGGQDG